MLCRADGRLQRTAVSVSDPEQVTSFGVARLYDAFDYASDYAKANPDDPVRFAPQLALLHPDGSIRLSRTS